MEDICRLCLGNNDLVWIFDEKVVNNVQDIIHTTSGVKILATDIVTQKVCATCLQITIKMFKFRTTALKNDRDLKAKYKQLEPDKKAAETATVGASSSASTSQKQKRPAEIDNPPQELPKKQEKNNDQPQNISAAPRPQPQLKKIHPSVTKMMRDHPDCKFPKIPMNEHYLPVITLATNEVDNWFKEHNYSDGDIERLKQFALNCQSPPISTCPSTGSISRPGSSLGSVETYQAPVVVGTAKRRKDVTDVKELPTLHQYQDDHKKIRLSGGCSIRPVNSANVQDQIPYAPSEALTNKQTSVGGSINNDRSEDNKGSISALLSKTGQSPPKSLESSPSSNIEVCDTKSTSIKLRVVSGNSETIITVDKSEIQKDSAVNDDNHSSVSIKDVTGNSGTSSCRYKSGEIETEHTSGSSNKRRKFVISDLDDDMRFDLGSGGDVTTEIEVRSHSSHPQQPQQQQQQQQQTTILVDKPRSPISVAKQPETKPVQTTTSTSDNVVLPARPSSASAQLDNNDFFAFRCAECPATYDRLLDFNLHVKLHADNRTLGQYIHTGTNSEKQVIAAIKSDSVFAPVPSPTPSTCSNSSEALSSASLSSSANDVALPASTSIITTTATDDTTSTSAFLIPKNTGSKLFTCRVCDSMHYSQKDLKVHMRRRHTRCQFCAARFETPEQREEHITLRCGITRVHRNLKLVKIELTKVDLDEQITRKYPEAFGLPSRNEEVGALEEPPTASSLNISNEDLFVQEDPSTKTTAAGPQDDVICISDDETSEVEFVADEPAATTPEPESPAYPNNMFRPNISIAGNNILQGVNIHEDDRSIMKHILTKLVHRQSDTLERPTEKDIVEGHNSKTLVLKNFRKQLYKFNIPVEICHGDKLSVSYKYGQNPAKTASNDKWNLLPPKQLLTSKEILAKKNMLNFKTIKAAPSPTVVGTAKTNVSAGNSTIQVKAVDPSKMTTAVSTNTTTTVKNSAVMGNAHATSTSPSTIDVGKKIQRTFGPAKSKDKKQNSNQNIDGSLQDKGPAPRLLSAQPASSSPSLQPRLVSTSNNNNNNKSPSPQQNYVILAMNNERPPEPIAAPEEGQQQPQQQLPVIQSVCTVNEPHVISTSSSQSPYVAVSLQQNGMMPAPGIVQTTSARLLNCSSTTTSAIVTPQQHIPNYNIQTVTNNIMQQQFVHQSAIVTHNDLIQASQATANLALTSGNSFMQYTQPSVMATTSPATCFIQPAPVPQQYTFAAPQPVPMVAAATNVHNPPAYQMTAAALPQQPTRPINNNVRTYPVQQSFHRPKPAKQSSKTAPVAGSSTKIQQRQHQMTKFQPIRPREVLSPENTSKASKDPKAKNSSVPQPKNSSNSDLMQSQVVQSNTTTSHVGNNSNVIQTSAQTLPEPARTLPEPANVSAGFTIRVKNLSELS